MWVDAAEKGRQTNWKYVIILVFLAGAAIFLGWALEQPLFPFGQKKIQTGVWQPADCGPGSKGTVLEGSLYLKEGGRLTVYGKDTEALFSMEEQGDIRICSGGFVAAYVPLGKTVSIIGKHGVNTVKVAGGVDAVFVGQSHMAVITAGSGYLTKTLFYDEDGNMTGQIGLVDAAMVSGAFLPEDKSFAALTVSTDGVWFLERYAPDGTLIQKTMIHDSVCSELQTVEDKILIRTDEALLCYDENGEVLNRLSFGTGEFVSWTSGNNKYIALVTVSRGNYKLRTLSCTGETLGEVQLPMEIRDLEVSGNQVLVLDFEHLRIYDAFCGLQSVFGEGARAVSIAADEKNIWLLGSGERMELLNS